MKSRWGGIQDGMIEVEGFQQSRQKKEHEEKTRITGENVK